MSTVYGATHPKIQTIIKRLFKFYPLVLLYAFFRHTSAIFRFVAMAMNLKIPAHIKKLGEIKDLDVIITRNIKDYRNSSIAVMTPLIFLKMKEKNES
ncbi:MAG TPA: hypothetical protein VF985_00585 [Mariniflexile sp.]